MLCSDLHFVPEALQSVATFLHPEHRACPGSRCPIEASSGKRMQLLLLLDVHFSDIRETLLADISFEVGVFDIVSFVGVV